MLFTFPSRYWYTIGLTGVFSLAGWSRRIRAGFLVSRVTQDTAMPLRRFAQGAVTRCGPAFQHGHARDAVCNGAVLLPRVCLATDTVWALPRSLATTGGIIVYFLFLEVLRCFSSLRSPPHTCVDDSASRCRVVPFGNPRINGHLHLPAAYRSLSRPSSPP